MNERRARAATPAGPLDEPAAPRPLQQPPVKTQALRPASRDGLGGTHPGRLWAGGIALVAILVAGGVAVQPHASPKHTSPKHVSPGLSAPPTTGTAARQAAGATPLASPTGPAFETRRVELAGGIALRVPTTWEAITDPGVLGASGLAALANFDLIGRCGGRAPLMGCAATLQLGSGDIVLTVANDESPARLAGLAVLSAAPQRIDGSEALLQVVEGSPGTTLIGVTVPPGCDAHRAWWIARPGQAAGWLDLEACSSRADRRGFRLAVDTVAQSVAFP